MTLDWQYLKEKVYFLDGSLRDIYVHNTTKEDWQKWADFVNTRYKTSFYIYETKVKEDKVDLSKVFEYWNGIHKCGSTATVCIDNIQVNAHFFTEDEIENDIAPSEINSIEDHFKLMDYMSKLSKLLDNTVELTPENEAGYVLISVDKDEIKIKNY